MPITSAYMRVPEVCAYLNISRASAYRAAKSGELPSQRKIGIRSVGWLRTEIESFAASRECVYPAKA